MTPALPRLRKQYRARILALAAKLEPGFRSGRYRGFTDPDADRVGDGRRPDGHPRWTPPLWRLERLARRELAPTEAAAHAVLAASTSTLATSDPGYFNARAHAETALGWDLLRLARQRGWTKALPTEVPTDRDLGLKRGRP